MTAEGQLPRQFKTIHAVMHRIWAHRSLFSEIDYQVVLMMLFLKVWGFISCQTYQPPLTIPSASEDLFCT